MKQLFLFLILILTIAACSDNNDTSGSTNSTSISSSVDTSIHTSSALPGDYDEKDYSNSDIINQPGSITLVTNATPIYSDSLLQYNTGIVLHPEEHITIEKYCGTTTKNNWIEPVYKIAYKTGPDIVHGYLSQSYIACRVDTLKSGNLVTLTLGYTKSKEKFIGTISLLNRGWDIIGTSHVELDITNDGDIPYSYTYYFSFEEKEPTGLDGITESFSIRTGYDACGYVSYVYTFLWNEEKEKLIACPETFAISEADIFHNNSYLVFPTDSLGKKGSILEIIEGDEYGDIQNNNTRTIQKDSTVIEYKWNKYSFISVSGDTIVKKSSTYSVSADY